MSEIEDLARQIAERSSEIAEIHRLMRTLLDTEDSGTTAFRGVLEARHQTLCKEIEDRNGQLGKLISETVRLEPGHDDRSVQSFAADDPTKRDQSPSTVNGVPPSAGREEVLTQGSERQLRGSLSEDGNPAPADVLSASRHGAGAARFDVLTAMSAAALTLSIVAVGLAWSLLAGLVVPRPLAIAPEQRGQLVPTAASPRSLIQPTFAPSPLPTDVALIATQPARGESPDRATEDTPEADPGESRLSSETEAPLEASDTAAVELPGLPRRVAGGAFRTVRLRGEPSLSGGVISSIPGGSTVFMLGASAVADGLRWVHVRTADGRDGWLVATALTPR